MFRSLYAKWLALFMAVIVVALALLSFLLYQRIRNDKMDAKLNELTLQARDVAFLASQMGPFSSPEVNDYFLWKTNQIRQEFDASIVVFGQNMDPIPIEDEVVEYTAEEVVEDAQALLNTVFSGVEVRVPSMQKDTLNPIFTVGVPYVSGGKVHAAVFIHTSEQNVEASYRDILGEMFRILLIILSLGAVSILIVCRFITRPLRAMAAAADRFARGDFEERLSVASRDEVGRLAESLNSMAEDLNRLEQTRREFVANVSHELRSPLTSMQGFINGILDGTVPEADREYYLSIVLDETRRLNKLITTLLDLSHIESGQTVLSKSVFDINDLICRVLIRQEARINEKALEVDVRFGSDITKVNADADRIEQVRINLIDNAIKYSDESGHIILSTSKEHGKIHVSVENDGPPLSREDLECVFERFYMADKAHTTGNGTGLGLAIVKSIVEQHGQRIDAYSDGMRGVRFVFTLEEG